MKELFYRIFKKNSGNIARDRLKVVLMSDHISATPEVMEQIKRDVYRVLKKHLNIETAQVTIQIGISQKTEQGVKNVKTIQIKGL